MFVRAARGSGRLVSDIAGVSFSKINRPLPQAVLTPVHNAGCGARAAIPALYWTASRVARRIPSTRNAADCPRRSIRLHDRFRDRIFRSDGFCDPANSRNKPHAVP